MALALTATLLLAGLAGCGNGNNTNNNNVNENASGLNYKDRTMDQTGFGLYDEGDRGFRVDDGRGDNRINNNATRNRGFGVQNGTEDGRFGTRHDGARLERKGTRGFNQQNTSKYGNRNMTGFERGIVGNNRPGMVDKDGVLNRDDKFRNSNFHMRGNNGFRGSNTGINKNDDRFGSFNFDNDNGNRNNVINRKGMDNNVRTKKNFNSQNNEYYRSKDGRLSREISNLLSGVDGIRNHHVVVHENNIIIGVEHDDDLDGIDQRIRERIKERAGNRNVHIVTEREQLKNIRGLNRRLQSNEPFEELGSTIDNILDDIGDAVKRPFEQSR